MSLFYAFIYPAVKPFTEATPSATKGDHSSDGTDISIKAVAHGLAVDMPVRLAGWTWADGGGDPNQDYTVKTRTDADNFIVTPTSCPTTSTNPSVVGTYALLPHPSGCKLPVIASSGLKINLPAGFWSVRSTGYDTTGASNTSELAWRRTTSATDVTLPTADFTVNTIEKQGNPLIEAGADEVIEIRGGGSQGAQSGLIFEVASGTMVVVIRPNERGFKKG